jgi:rhodanese-related sulfurtransferase
MPMDYKTLVSAETLKAHLNDTRWAIFDVRHDLFDLEAGPRAYRAGHVPGAQFASIDDDLSGTKTGRNGRHPLPDRDALVARFRAWGLRNDSQIVAYDAQGGQFAARLWWLSRWLGHPRVAVLDGGWPAWLAAGGAVETTAVARSAGNFSAAESLVKIVTADAVLAALVPVVAACVLALLAGGGMQPRYVTAAIPGTIVCIAAGLLALRPLLLGRAACAMLLACAATTTVLQLSENRREDYRAASAEIRRGTPGST